MSFMPKMRRALFPTDDNTVNSGGLGHISPICFDSDSEDEEYVRLIREKINLVALEKLNDDYDILGVVNSCSDQVRSPLMSDVSVIESPSKRLKTPNDTISDNSKIPKLIRKTLLDSSFENSDDLNHSKSSKVRTALFPELEIGLPVKSFYPKSEDSKISYSLVNKSLPVKRSNSRKQPLFLCSRKNRKLGQINAGVRHKIKRPKTRKIDKNLLIKAALNIIENSPLNAHLPELKENAPPPMENLRKRPLSPSPEQDKSKKFFKTRHSTLNKSLCDMTSDLALNSPTKSEPKLFSVFYPTKQAKTEVKNSPKSGAKKFRKISENQMLLDAGQKRFGATQCPECKIVYHMGDPNDEIMHLNYHNAGNIFRFNGWKNERVVFTSFGNGRIIQILPTDSKIWWKKVREIIDIVNRDLGFYDIPFNTDNSQIFMYIRNKSVIGVLVAQSKSSANKLLTSPTDQIDLCSEESYPVKCGVSRIWVNCNYRKQGIGTALMDSLKKNFVFGSILRNEDIAFSSPTEAGKNFGTNYFKTSNFLIYYL